MTGIVRLATTRGWWRSSRGSYARQGRRETGAAGQQEVLVEEMEIIRLNIARFKRMLETETSDASRQTIEGLIREFERMLPLSGRARRTGAMDSQL